MSGADVLVRRGCEPKWKVSSRPVACAELADKPWRRRRPAGCQQVLDSLPSSPSSPSAPSRSAVPKDQYTSDSTHLPSSLCSTSVPPRSEATEPPSPWSPCSPLRPRRLAELALELKCPLLRQNFEDHDVQSFSLSSPLSAREPSTKMASFAPSSPLSAREPSSKTSSFAPAESPCDSLRCVRTPRALPSLAATISPMEKGNAPTSRKEAPVTGKPSGQLSDSPGSAEKPVDPKQLWPSIASVDTSTALETYNVTDVDAETGADSLTQPSVSFPLLDLARLRTNWDPHLWLQARANLLSTGDFRQLHVLWHHANQSTLRALEQESYYVGGKDVKLPHAPINFDWFGECNVTDDIPFDGRIAPPLLVCDAAPLDILTKLRGLYGNQHRIILVAEVNEFDSKGMPSLRRPGTISPACLPVRSTFARYAQGMQAQLQGSDLTMQSHLSAEQDPYILFCSKVSLFRGSRQEGYPFLPEACHLDVIATSVAEARPNVQLRKEQVWHTQGGTNAKTKSEWYTQESDRFALMDRLRLIALAALEHAAREENCEVHSENEDDDFLEDEHDYHNEHDDFEDVDARRPILILGTLGCGGGRAGCHPRHALAHALKEWRQVFSPFFRSIYVCCGGEDRQDPKLAHLLDRVSNAQFYKLVNSSDLSDNATPWHWNTQEIDLCVRPSKLESAFMACEGWQWSEDDLALRRPPQVFDDLARKKSQKRRNQETAQAQKDVMGEGVVEENLHGAISQMAEDTEEDACQGENTEATRKDSTTSESLPSAQFSNKRLSTRRSSEPASARASLFIADTAAEDDGDDLLSALERLDCFAQKRVLFGSVASVTLYEKSPRGSMMSASERGSIDDTHFLGSARSLTSSSSFQPSESPGPAQESGSTRKGPLLRRQCSMPAIDDRRPSLFDVHAPVVDLGLKGQRGLARAKTQELGGAHSRRGSAVFSLPGSRRTSLFVPRPGSCNGSDRGPSRPSSAMSKSSEVSCASGAFSDVSAGSGSEVGSQQMSRTASPTQSGRPSIAGMMNAMTSPTRYSMSADSAAGRRLSRAMTQTTSTSTSDSRRMSGVSIDRRTSVSTMASDKRPSILDRRHSIATTPLSSLGRSHTPSAGVNSFGTSVHHPRRPSISHAITDSRRPSISHAITDARRPSIAHAITDSVALYGTSHIDEIIENANVRFEDSGSSFGSDSERDDEEEDGSAESSTGSGKHKSPAIHTFEASERELGETVLDVGLLRRGSGVGALLEEYHERKQHMVRRQSTVGAIADLGEVICIDGESSGAGAGKNEVFTAAGKAKALGRAEAHSRKKAHPEANDGQDEAKHLHEIRKHMREKLAALRTSALKGNMLMTRLSTIPMKAEDAEDFEEQLELSGADEDMPMAAKQASTRHHHHKVERNAAAASLYSLTKSHKGPLQSQQSHLLLSQQVSAAVHGKMTIS